jgi:serine phosphatase RsbU (regulator of sigma subunit)
MSAAGPPPSSHSPAQLGHDTRRWFHGLTFKQAAITLGVALLFSLLSIAWVLYSEWRRVHTAVQIQKQEVLSLVRKSAAEALDERNKAMRKPLLEGLLANPLVVHVELTQTVGAGSDADDVERVNGVVVIREYFPRLPKYELSEKWGERLFGDIAVASVNLTAERDGRPVTNGTLSIVFSPEIMADRFFERALEEVWVAAVREFVIALAIVALFYGLITRPLVRLTQGIAQVDPQNPGVWKPPELRLHRRDELGQMATTVHGLMQSFQSGLDARDKADRELQQINAELEQRVESRTQQLQDAFNELDSAHTDLSLANRRVLESIEAAQRIQTAMLPSHEFARQWFKDFHVWWQPLHTVGGDIYAMHKYGHNESKLLLFLADCTGHGVPGAFITLVVTNALEQLVRGAREGRELTPVEILVALDKMVRYRLHQSVREVGDEGFDAAVLLCDPSAGTVQFASAGICLLYEPVNGAMEELRGARCSLGYADAHPALERALVTRQFALTGGERFHLFTDGLIDQLGQDADYAHSRPPRLYGRRRLVQYLSQVAAQVGPDAAVRTLHLQQHLQRWRGESALLDDITYIQLQVIDTVLSK